MAGHSTPSELLTALLTDWQLLLQGWSTSGRLTAAAQEALLLGGVPQALEELVAQWSAGVFTGIPPIVLMPASAMSGAAGAYAISTGNIYLNQDWLAEASAAQVIAVLTEELGHHLDGLLNVEDTPGDEGVWFSKFLTDNNLDANAIFALRNQTDVSRISVSGALVAAELAAAPNVGVSPTASANLIVVDGKTTTLSIELDIFEESGFGDDGYGFIGGINLAGPSEQSIYLGLSKADIIAQVNNTATFRKTIELGFATPREKWHISGINLTDKYGNRRDAYLQGFYGGGTPTQGNIQDYLRELGLSSVDPSFTVVNAGTFVDTSSPTILSLRTSAPVINVTNGNSALSIELDISEASGFIDDGYGFIGGINLAGPSGQSIYFGLSKTDIVAQVNYTVTFKKTIDMGIATPGGKWYISGINLTDKYGNRRDAYLQGFYGGGTPTQGNIQDYLRELGLSSVDPSFTVVNAGTFVDTSSPTILSLRTSAPVINVTNGNSALSIELDISEASGFVDDGYGFIGGINLAGPSGQSFYLGLSKTDIVAQVNNTATFRKTIDMGIATPGGKWYISGINLTDKYGNRRDAYLQGFYGGGTPTQGDIQDYLRELGLSSVDPSFTVVNAGTLIDANSPTVAALRISPDNASLPPTALAFANATSSLAENTSTSVRIKVADIIITDDALGTEIISISGADADSFELDGNSLYLKAGTVLNYEAKSAFAISVSARDLSLPGSTPVSAAFNLSVTDVNEAPTALAFANATSSLAENSSTSARIKVAEIVITDDVLGTETIALSGVDAGSFELDGSNLYLKAGTVLNYEAKSAYAVSVSASDLSIAGSPPVSATFILSVTDLNEAPTALAFANATSSLTENSSTSVRVKVAEIVITDDALGTETISLQGADAAAFEVDGTALFLKAGTSLNYETKTAYAVTVSVGDTTLSGSSPVSTAYSLAVTDVNEAPTAVALTNTIASLAENTNTSSRIKLADIAITDDALGSNSISLLGTDAAAFELEGTALFLKAGTSLDYETKTAYAVTVSVGDTTISGSSPVSTGYKLAVSDVNEASTADGNPVIAGASGDDTNIPGISTLPDFTGNAQTVTTGSGNDELDVALVNGHDNRIFTGSGADTIYAGSRDVITGGSDSDQIWATAGDGNRLSGMGGDDDFIIGSAANRALGGAGNDKFTILGEAGTNYLNGGAGADHFWLIGEPGDMPAVKQYVMDFSAGEDMVCLRGLTFSALSFSQVGADTLLTVSGTAIGHFSNTSVVTLNNQANFLFG